MQSYQILSPGVGILDKSFNVFVNFVAKIQRGGDNFFAKFPRGGDNFCSKHPQRFRGGGRGYGRTRIKRSIKIMLVKFQVQHIPLYFIKNVKIDRGFLTQYTYTLLVVFYKFFVRLGVPFPRFALSGWWNIQKLLHGTPPSNLRGDHPPPPTPPGNVFPEQGASSSIYTMMPGGGGGRRR